MATKPTPGGSDGTYGTEMNAFLDVSLASDGKIKTEALQTDSTAPSADAALANKKYVDDQITANVETNTLTTIGQSELPGGLQLKWGSLNITVDNATAIDFTDEGLTDFDNACLQAFASYKNSSEVNQTYADGISVTATSTSGLTIYNDSSGTKTIAWFAIGH